MLSQEQKFSLYFGLGRGCVLHSFRLTAMLFLASRQIIVTVCMCVCAPALVCTCPLQIKETGKGDLLHREPERSLEIWNFMGNVCVCPKLRGVGGPKDPFWVIYGKETLFLTLAQPWPCSSLSSVKEHKVGHPTEATPWVSDVKGLRALKSHP